MFFKLAEALAKAPFDIINGIAKGISDGVAETTGDKPRNDQDARRDVRR